MIVGYAGHWLVERIYGPVMFDILYEDDDIIAINKPEGLSAIPERQPEPATRRESLYEMLCAQRSEKLYIIHRIDKDTSGVIIFGKSADAHRHFGRQFEWRTTHKVYLALVHGLVTPEQGLIDKPLGQFGSGRVGVNPQHGRSAVTEYLVLHRFAAHTLLEAYPKTGRRHQIRVHLYSIGHAIVGDRRYGDLPLQRQYPRMMLHAQKLTIRRRNNQLLTLEASIPASFDRVLHMIESA